MHLSTAGKGLHGGLFTMRYDEASRGCYSWPRTLHALHTTALADLTCLHCSLRSQVHPFIAFLLTTCRNTIEKPILEAAETMVSASVEACPALLLTHNSSCLDRCAPAPRFPRWPPSP